MSDHETMPPEDAFGKVPSNESQPDVANNTQERDCQGEQQAADQGALEELITNTDGKFLGFRQPFDGSQPEVPQEERAEVARLFEDYVTGVLDANNAGFSPKYNGTTGRFDSGRKISFPTKIDHRDAEVLIKKVDRELPDRYVTIDITEQRQHGIVEGEAYYYLEQGETLRRHDLLPLSPMEQELQSNRPDPNAPMSPLEAMTILHDSLVAGEEDSAKSLDGIRTWL